MYTSLPSYLFITGLSPVLVRYVPSFVLVHLNSYRDFDDVCKIVLNNT